MDSHRYSWREEPHGTALSSLVLLLVFMLAAAFLAGMVLFRPWADQPAAAPPEVQAPSPAADAAPPAAAEPAPGP